MIHSTTQCGPNIWYLHLYKKILTSNPSLSRDGCEMTPSLFHCPCEMRFIHSFLPFSLIKLFQGCTSIVIWKPISPYMVIWKPISPYLLLDKCSELHKIDGTFVLFTAKWIRHFPLLKSRKTQRQTDQLHLNDLQCYVSQSCPIKEHWRTNLLINQHTNKPVNWNLLENGYLWVTYSPTVNINLFYFYYVGCADIKRPTDDCHLTMKAHITNLVCSANFELRFISSICHLLSTDATKTLVSAFVLLCHDYCKYLLSGWPHYLLYKLKKFRTTLLTLSWEFQKLTTSVLILLLFIGCPLIHGYGTNSLLSVVIASTHFSWRLDWTPENLCASPPITLI